MEEEQQSTGTEEIEGSPSTTDHIEHTNPTTHIETPPEQLGSSPLKKNRMHVIKNPKVLIVGALLLVAFASSALTYFLVNTDTDASLSKESDQSQAEDTTGKDSALPIEKAVETTVVDLAFTWRTPKPVGPLPLFEDLSSYYASSDPDNGLSLANEHEYFLVGENETAKAYVTIGPSIGLGDNIALFVVESAGNYVIYQQHSEGWFYAEADGAEPQYQGPKLSSKTTVSNKDILKDIEPKEKIVYLNQTLTNVGGSYNIFRFIKTGTPAAGDGSSLAYTKVADIPEGTLYKVISVTEPTYEISNFLLVYRNNMSSDFLVGGELSREKIDPITWSDKSRNTDDYASVGRGCGTSGANEIALGVNKSQLVEIGKSDKGQTIYGFASSNAGLLKAHFDEYASVDGEGFYEAQDQNLTLDQFFGRRPIYLVEDSLNRFIVFSNLRYVPVGGCAKPVVYLYPESAQTVDVQVGADVTVSDPFYPTGGWKNVTAQPNGQLTYKGSSYDSLFWEGFGHGEYPIIDKGIIVKRSQVISTWKSQLTQLNFNEKEIQDFVTFWEDRIPNKPYVRISWLTTNDLQKLAPLYVTGGVDTLIRAFLDMEGLDSMQQITPQKLAGIKRTGFTVTEWGGLVRDGSIPRMQ